MVEIIVVSLVSLVVGFLVGKFCFPTVKTTIVEKKVYVKPDESSKKKVSKKKESPKA